MLSIFPLELTDYYFFNNNDLISHGLGKKGPEFGTNILVVRKIMDRNINGIIIKIKYKILNLESLFGLEKIFKIKRVSKNYSITK